MYTLYSHPYSQHARRVIALLESAALPYQTRHVALETGEHRSAGFLAINPNHQIPTLIDDGLALHESNAILRYLCVKHGLDDWYPGQPKLRGQVEQWLDWNQCRLSPAVVDIVLNKVFLGEAGDTAAIARGETLLAELLPILEAALTNCDYLAGTRPSIADLSVGSNLTQLGFAGAAPEAGPVAQWYSRLLALPGFRAAMPARDQATTA